MGTWGVGIFEDDLALDIRLEFEELLEEGFSVSRATKEILERYEDELLDEEAEDEEAIIYLALAALQLEHGKVMPKIKSKVLEIIKTGQGLEEWSDHQELLEQRKQVLEELRTKLV